MGLPVHKIRMTELLDCCERAIAWRQPMVLGVVNAAKLVHSRSDPQLRDSLLHSDIVTADGQAVVWLSRLMGQAVPERVAGIDVMYKLMERANNGNYRVFFLGAHCDVVKQVVHNASRLYPGLRVAGYADGYFDLERDGEQIARQIRSSGADILFVAMPSPRKESFIDRWGKHMNVTVCHGVGGSFDVFAGKVKRAPTWMQNTGLEWFYRVLQEPRRMWKRYLVTNTLFLVLSVREIFLARLGMRK